jgi:uncharacterized membrane protein YbhN (UPF0104 family)
MMSAHSHAAPEQRQDEPQTRRGEWSRWLAAALLVGALVFAALHFGDFKRFAVLTSKAEPGWLAGALLLQLSTYVLLAAQWSLALRAGGTSYPFRELLPLTISKLFADQVIPTAGVSGNVLLVDRLTDTGVPRRNAVAAVILAIIAYYASYAVCAVAAVVLLWVHGRLSLIIAGLAGLMLAVAAAIPGAALWLQGRGIAALPGWLARRKTVRELLKMVGEAPPELVRDPRLIAGLATLNLAVFLADAATLLLCLFAVGERGPVEAPFVAFTMASIVVTLGPVPLGLGSFEAVSVGTLRLMGVGFEAALSATLLLRGFTLWLPLFAGLLLTRKTMKRGG